MAYSLHVQINSHPAVPCVRVMMGCAQQLHVVVPSIVPATSHLHKWDRAAVPMHSRWPGTAVQEKTMKGPQH